jgi:hypothetical protein
MFSWMTWRVEGIVSGWCGTAPGLDRRQSIQYMYQSPPYQDPSLVFSYTAQSQSPSHDLCLFHYQNTLAIKYQFHHTSTSNMDHPPPSYTNPVDPAKDRLPPYRARHSFASPEEELAALKEFAESKLYVQPGSQGTLPSLRDTGVGLKGLAWGGMSTQPGRNDQTGDWGWPAPETPEERKARREREKMEKKEEKARRGSLGERAGRRLMSVVGAAKGGKTDGTASTS